MAGEERISVMGRVVGSLGFGDGEGVEEVEEVRLWLWL